MTKTKVAPFYVGHGVFYSVLRLLFTCSHRDLS